MWMYLSLLKGTSERNDTMKFLLIHQFTLMNKKCKIIISILISLLLFSYLFVSLLDFQIHSCYTNTHEEQSQNIWLRINCSYLSIWNYDLYFSRLSVIFSVQCWNKYLNVSRIFIKVIVKEVLNTNNLDNSSDHTYE